jgi:hypothetical protein
MEWNGKKKEKACSYTQTESSQKTGEERTWPLSLITQTFPNI